MMRPVLRYATGLTALAALILALLFCLRPTGLGNGLAYGEVQKAVRQVKTVILDWHHPKTPHRDFREFHSRDTNRVRFEYPNGFVRISDGKEGKVLALNPQSKTAVLMHGSRGDSSLGELMDDLLHMEQEATRPLGERRIDGRKLVGFELKPVEYQPPDTRRTVWVDPQTRLPMRAECVPLDPENPRTASLHAIVSLRFDEPLEPELFSLTPPSGYTLSETAPLEMPTPPPPDDEESAAPVIKPQVGIGTARFGMTRDEVIAALGEPQDISKYWHPTPEQNRVVEEAMKKAREENLDPFEQQRLLNEAYSKFDPTKRKPGGVRLKYGDRGFILSVANDGGFKGIQCYAHHPGMRPFTGKTAEGIGIGATAEEIERTYGPPDAKGDPSPGVFLIHYLDLGLSFQGDKGRLWLIMARAPDDK
jgi:outer membrane lipoprotein-sorting protein